MSKADRNRRYRQKQNQGGGVSQPSRVEDGASHQPEVAPSPSPSPTKTATSPPEKIADTWIHPRDRPPRRRLWWPLPPEGFCNRDGYGADGEYRPMLPTWTHDPPLPDDPSRDQFISIRAFYQQQYRR